MTQSFIRLALTVCVGMAAIGCSKEQQASNNTSNTSTTPATKPSADAAAPAAGTPEAGVNPLFTLPPSQGPAPHQFKQVTLLRSGPSGDLEMQLTGDGIYRIRDHGRGKSYSGDGKLTEAQIGEWAALMKDWESLKESYIPTPAPAEGDKVEIIYGGKKVEVNTAVKDNPKEFTDAYARLLALAAEGQKEATAAP